MAGVCKNIVGVRFGRLLVIGRAGSSMSQKAVWLCLCDCGILKPSVSGALVSGNTRSCGCLNREAASNRQKVNLTGRRFGRLTVTAYFGKTKRGKGLWECLCDCGVQCKVETSLLLGSHTRSCGCLQREIISKIIVKRLQTTPFGTSKSCFTFLNYVQQVFNVLIEREVRISNRVFDGRVGKVLFEIDGSYWHSSSQANDILKDKIALEHGYCLVRCTVDTVKDVPQRFSFYKNSIAKALIMKGVLV